MIDRRDAFRLAAAGAATAVGAAAAPGLGVAQGRVRQAAAPGELIVPQPLPRQAPTREGFVDVPGARLYYWDTGGVGQPILLAHPGTGSALIWSYQQPVFAAAGYRVIAWSRRGHARSQTTGTGRGDGNDDIERIADALKLGRFHALGSAAGGGTMLDYAVANGQRLRSLTIACSIGNLADPAYQKLSASLRPDSFNRLPAEVRELGPCYRAADPEGTERWIALEKAARTVPPGPPPGAAGGQRTGTQWSHIAALKMPVLWMTGDADLFTPPPLLAAFHRRLPGSEMRVIDGAGHSAYWEQPRAFNAVVLDFLRRRGAR